MPMVLIHGQGTKILHATQCGQKKKTLKLHSQVYLNVIEQHIPVQKVIQFLITFGQEKSEGRATLYLHPAG